MILKKLWISVFFWSNKLVNLTIKKTSNLYFRISLHCGLVAYGLYWFCNFLLSLSTYFHYCFINSKHTLGCACKELWNNTRKLHHEFHSYTINLKVRNFLNSMIVIQTSYYNITEPNNTWNIVNNKRHIDHALWTIWSISTHKLS